MVVSMWAFDDRSGRLVMMHIIGCEVSVVKGFAMLHVVTGALLCTEAMSPMSKRVEANNKGLHFG